MKSFVRTISVGFFVLSSGVLPIFAESGTTTPASWSGSTGSIQESVTGSTESTSNSTEQELLISAINPIDTQHVELVFNQPVIKESIRARIAKQSDESNVRVESFSWGSDGKTINIILADSLSWSTSYKLTLISAISEEGIIIKDGAYWLKEFTTPKNLKIFEEIVLDAPNNPTAIIATEVPTVKTTTDEKKWTGATKTEPAKDAKELPSAWMNPFIFAILAGAIAFIIIMRKRRA